jgi:hypothetical protein
MLPFSPELLNWHTARLERDRLREAEAERLGDLARQFTRAQRNRVSDCQPEVESCTAS